MQKKKTVFSIPLKHVHVNQPLPKICEEIMERLTRKAYTRGELAAIYHRPRVTKCLDLLSALGVLRKKKLGNKVYYYVEGGQ